jgi:hypothetical protein
MKGEAGPMNQKTPLYVESFVSGPGIEPGEKTDNQIYPSLLIWGI